MKFLAIAVIVAGCADAQPPIRFDEAWPAQSPSSYDGTTAVWTRSSKLEAAYQEAVDLHATFKSPDWRAAHADRVAAQRGLAGAAKDQVVAQAQADMAGPYEFELMLTTWDRRENDLDRGQKSNWHVALIDEQGHEIAPIEIVKDRRPIYTLRAEFADINDFATAYVARFPRTTPVLGANVQTLRLRMSGERGAVELVWAKDSAKN